MYHPLCITYAYIVSTIEGSNTKKTNAAWGSTKRLAKGNKTNMPGSCLWLC